MALTRRILSGTRPTGRLHLGNYVGALKNWVNLQDSYECFFMVADWHALTSEYADPSNLPEFSSQMVLDWLSIGLDPQRSTIFVQSKVKQHAELNLLLGMMTPLGWLERCPTYKDQINQMSNKDLETHGFLGYPLLQAADIMAYRATAVPVGEDQIPHLEMCRELVRRFNNFYGEVFPEPQPILSPVPKMVGLDGRKMSKSYDNCIYLSDSRPTVVKKVKTMITDPARIKRSDVGHPEVCNVCAYQHIFNPSQVAELEEGCRNATIGCVDCKLILAEKINQVLDPFREKRVVYEREPKLVKQILAEGNFRAQTEAEATMKKVREVMHLPE